MPKKKKKKKRQGGWLKGPSHKEGGIPAIVGGKEPIELEGDEYVIKAESAGKLGKAFLDEINETGEVPYMRGGGRVGASYRPTASIPPKVRFPKGVRMMGHGGEVSISDDTVSSGDIHTTHSHSGYKVGE